MTTRAAYYATARELRKLTTPTGDLYVPTGIRLPLEFGAIERLVGLRKRTDRLAIPTRREALARAHEGLAAFRRGDNLFEETEEQALRSIVSLARQGYAWAPEGNGIFSARQAR